MRTQVGIVGAGPAGLMLGHLLHRAGIECVILEARSREYVEKRIRAGVLEQGTIDLLDESGVGERMRREGLLHHGIELRFDRRAHRIPLSDLTDGRAVMIYGPTEIVKDLVRARLDTDAPLVFEAEAIGVEDLDTTRPGIRYRHEGAEHKLRCDIVAGCDGFHGVCRPAVPERVLSVRQREYPFGWLGILAQVPPSTEELIYAFHADRGFALHSLRSLELSRLYLQVDPADDIDNWPDERIWEELHARIATDDGWQLNEGPVLEKGITPMRSFVAEPMRHGRLFLAGDAAHIVPPTGAKGLNLAVADVRVLAAALVDWFEHGDDTALKGYSEACLRRVWRVQHFSWWMTSMLHRPAGQDPFERKLQAAQLRYVTRSRAGATTLAENYVGLARV
ncbi:MAG: 4-hydroxybenzoate 3-monooxygenase [Solirubrobacteraceae bacterium]